MSNRIEKRRNELLGLEFTNKHGHRCFIIDYKDAHNVMVMFYDTMSISTMEYSNLKKGSFLDRYKPSLYGVGYLGKSGRTEQNKMAYRAWNHILSRCYNPEVQKKQPYYYDCSVDPRWHCLAVFEEWFIQQEQRHFKEDYGIGRRWSIDKDILVRGNKVYSPETCCFVPNEINAAVTKPKRRIAHIELPEGVGLIKPKTTGCKIGYTARAHTGTTEKERYLGYYDTPEKAFKVYKRTKEGHIKSLAEKWKGKIDEKVYKALINWKIGVDP